MYLLRSFQVRFKETRPLYHPSNVLSLVMLEPFNKRMKQSGQKENTLRRQGLRKKQRD